MSWQSSGGRDRETFPEIADEIGEDPARYLDNGLMEWGSSHTDKTMLRTARSRIRGIDRLDVVDAWIDVETSLDRGPRQKILAWLNQRKQHLEENGERPDLSETPVDERPVRYQRHDRNLPAVDVYVVREDGERVPIEEARSSTASAKVSSIGADGATAGGDEA